MWIDVVTKNGFIRTIEVSKIISFGNTSNGTVIVTPVDTIHCITPVEDIKNAMVQLNQTFMDLQ